MLIEDKLIDMVDSSKEKELRTFETRLQFIKKVFSDKYDETTMLKSCIQYKLNISFEQYMEDVNRSMAILQQRNAMPTMKKLSK